MRRVLVAFDGSDASSQALIKVSELIRRPEIFVLYVIDEDDVKWPSRMDISVIWGENIEELERNILELHKRHAQKILEKAKRLLKGKKAKFFYDVGNPPDTILKNAEKLSCDLIAIGDRSKSQIELILGSVTEKVIAKSRIPVIVVKHYRSE